jgi:Domain of unknown function (DUF397)
MLSGERTAVGLLGATDASSPERSLRLSRRATDCLTSVRFLVSGRLLDAPQLRSVLARERKGKRQMDAMNWRKASYSGNGEACIEAATSAPAPGRVLVRDSTDRQGATLVFAPDTWQEFAARLKG